MARSRTARWPLPEGGLARRIPQDPGGTTCQGGGGPGPPVQSLRGAEVRPSVLLFLAARIEPHPEEHPREAPGAHPAPGGSILPHKPGNWQTADGQVHFPSGVSAPRYGEGDAISRRGRVPWAGVRRRVVEGASTWRPDVSPPPARFAFKCCAISPLASSAGAHCARGRHRPRPPTSGHREGGGRWAVGGGGRRQRSDVGGRGCPTPESGRWRAGLPDRWGGDGRCTSLASEQRGPEHVGLAANTTSRPPDFSRQVTPSCRNGIT